GSPPRSSCSQHSSRTRISTTPSSTPSWRTSARSPTAGFANRLEVASKSFPSGSSGPSHSAPRTLALRWPGLSTARGCAVVSDKWGGPERSDGDGSPDRPDEAQEHAGKTQRESQGRAWRDPREWVADEDRSTYFRGHEPMSDEEIAHLHAENAAKGFAYEYRPDDDPDDFADDLTVSDDRRATRDSDEFHLRSADALHKDRTPDSLGKDGASGPGEPDGSQPDGDRP